MTQLTTPLYTFVGTDDGRLLQYSHQKQNLIARLFSFHFFQTNSKNSFKKNALKSIAFYHDLLAGSAYGGEIILVNIYNRAKKKHILKSKSSITALMFLSKEKLLSANVDGEIHIYNLLHNTSKKLVTTLHEITSVIYIKEDNTLIVSAKTNYISRIDLNSETVLENKFHQFTSIVEEMILLEDNNLELRLKSSQIKTLKLKLHKSTIKQIPLEPPKLSLKGEKLLLKAYEENNFQLCYELIDEYNLYPLELALLLESHWKKLMLECEEFAYKGEAKAILSELKELLFVQTRAEKIGDLLRLSFFRKIELLSEEKLYKSAMNILYSYIDIFGYDKEMGDMIRKLEFISSQKIAIFNDLNDRKSRLSWRNYFHQAN